MHSWSFTKRSRNKTSKMIGFLVCQKRATHVELLSGLPLPVPAVFPLLPSLLFLNSPKHFKELILCLGEL